MESFKVLRLRELEGRARGSFEASTLAELDPGEVVVRVGFSSVNYKDALAVTGRGRIVRRFPCVGGIDLVGTVAASEDPRFTVGDAVLATGCGLGVEHDGGYAEFARVRADWLVPLPSGMSPWEAMALGTAGFTAALALHRMEHDGLEPGGGPVVVSGATGGVGSIMIELLAQRGYEVVALTGKPEAEAELRALGAREVLLRSALDLEARRPLGRATWAGAVDNLGGDVLGWMLGTAKVGGVVASIGLAASMELRATVAPLILRGVSLLGIDSSNSRMPLRRELWRRLGAELRPAKLAERSRTEPFEALPAVCDELIEGRARGRVVIAIGG